MSADAHPGWRAWIAAARPRTLPAAVAPVVVGSALAGRDGRFDAGAAGLCLAFALLVQVGANFANDYFDFVKGADTAARVGPRRAVAEGWVTPGGMRLAMGLVFAAAFGVGLGLLEKGGPWLLVVGASCIVSGIAYTGGPFPLGYRGLGDLFVFLFFGVVAVCATYFVQAGRVTGEAFAVSVPLGLLCANILLVNNYRDYETDAVAGKKTLIVRFGRGFGRAQHALSLVGALAVPLVLWGALGRSPWCLLPLVLTPVAVAHARRLRAASSGAEFNRLLGDTAKLLLYYAVLLAAGLLAG